MKTVGRFAPSPTGALHTGSLVTAVGSWLMTRSAGGRWLLRIDDLDSPRQITGMVDDILKTLELFGLWWDGEITWQSRNLAHYEQAFVELQQQGLIYPCGCSRREIALAASAPHSEEDAFAYPGSCRSGLQPEAVIRSWRVRVPEEELCFQDLLKGQVCQYLNHSCGDLAVRRGDGVFTYQLAVVVDDQLTGVTQVVRGADLLSSTLRQIYLQRVLGYQQPEYGHLPLVTGRDGLKLSKRDNPVSHQLGNLQGKEGILLYKVLQFLGQAPPRELEGAACDELLRWGIANFNAGRIPAQGGALTL